MACIVHTKFLEIFRGSENAREQILGVEKAYKSTSLVHLQCWQDLVWHSKCLQMYLKPKTCNLQPTCKLQPDINFLNWLVKFGCTE